MTTEQIFNVILVGSGRVGKSTLLRRFEGDVTPALSSSANSVGVAFKEKTFLIDNDSVRCRFWDIAEDDLQGIRKITPAAHSGADGLIVVFDLTNPTSFENVCHWLRRQDNNKPKVVIGNKADLVSFRKVDPTENLKMRQREKVKYFEVSAMNGAFVQSAFRGIALEILNSPGLVQRSAPEHAGSVAGGMQDCSSKRNIFSNLRQRLRRNSDRLGLTHNSREDHSEESTDDAAVKQRNRGRRTRSCVACTIF